MARLIRSYAQVGFENMALWHERDISHSSAERYILPDSTMTIYYMIEKTRHIIENIKIFDKNIVKNIDITNGLVYSQRVMLALVDVGMSREEAYTIVQKYALECWETGKSFKEMLKKDENISKLLADKIDEIFKPDYYLRNIEEIYKRFGRQE